MDKIRTNQELEEKIEKLQEELAKKVADEHIMVINQMRLQSLWKISSMVSSDFTDICDILLEEIVTMTESQYGFYGFITGRQSTPDP